MEELFGAQSEDRGDRSFHTLRNSLEVISIWGHILKESPYERQEVEIRSEGLPNLDIG